MLRCIVIALHLELGIRVDRYIGFDASSQGGHELFGTIAYDIENLDFGLCHDFV